MQELLRRAASQRGCGQASAVHMKAPGHWCSSSLVMTGPRHPHSTHPTSPWLAADRTMGTSFPGSDTGGYASVWEPGKEGHSVDLVSRTLQGPDHEVTYPRASTDKTKGMQHKVAVSWREGPTISSPQPHTPTEVPTWTRLSLQASEQSPWPRPVCALPCGPGWLGAQRGSRESQPYCC